MAGCGPGANLFFCSISLANFTRQLQLVQNIILHYSTNQLRRTLGSGDFMVRDDLEAMGSNPLKRIVCPGTLTYVVGQYSLLYLMVKDNGYNNLVDSLRTTS